MAVSGHTSIQLAKGDNLKEREEVTAPPAPPETSSRPE